MSGVNLSDEGGDVFQNGDNVFTGTNTYNVNLPTSGVTPTLSNQLITKAFADATYAGGGAAGDVFLAGTNAFTGTNTYNTNRPTSNIVGGVGLVSDDFITKADGDSIYGSGDGDAVLSAGTAAAPQQFTGENAFSNDTTFNDDIIQDIANTDFNQSAISQGINQTGNDSQIAQGGTNNIIKQIGAFATFKQSGVSALLEQTNAANDGIITTTGFVRMGQAPTIGDDCVNKTYFDANAATLTGGLSELNPQEFTGFNNFTKDTHFEEDIDADDSIRMNGSSAQFRIAAFAMTSGDTAAGNGGNIFDQKNAGFYGNSIYQISGPVVPLVPAANTCVFHQTGLTDIIRTEGKAQARLAPTVGDDLCNKTYVDATAGGGGSSVGMRAYLSSTSGAIASPWIFSVSNYCSPSTLYNNTTGKFLIPSDGKYYFSLLVNIITNSSNDYMNFGLTSPAGTSPFISYVRGLQSFFAYLSAANRNYHTINVSGVFDLTAGTQLQWGNDRAVSYILSGTLETSICCFKVG